MHASTTLAADRPGTPINVTAIAQAATASRAPSVRVLWTNTATEDVCVEFYTTLNGSPTDLGAGCVNHGLSSSDYVFEGLQPQATYCFQVRAREWNGGDPQDGLVSNDWSAPACTTATAAYVPPPSISISSSASSVEGGAIGLPTNRTDSFFDYHRLYLSGRARAEDDADSATALRLTSPVSAAWRNASRYANPATCPPWVRRCASNVRRLRCSRQCSPAGLRPRGERRWR
jgi:hypothetical protein